VRALGLRRALRRRFGHRARFQFAVVLTIMAVAYVAVPPVVRFVETMTGYSPRYYEPKDFDRGEWLRQQEPGGDAVLDSFSSQTVSSGLIFLIVAVVWLTLVPYRSPRRRPPPR